MNPAGRTAVALLALTIGLPALAQDEAAPTTGVDAHNWALPAQDGDPRDLLFVERPGRFSGGDFYLSSVFEYAGSAVTLRREDPAGNITADPVLDNLVVANVVTGVAFHERIRLDVAMPVYFNSSFSGLTGRDAPLSAAGIGDLRAAVMVAILRPSGDLPLGLGVVPYLTVPLGDPDRFLGVGGFAGGGKVAATFEADALTFTADVGVDVSPGVQDVLNLNGGANLQTGLGVGYMLTDQIGVNLEARLRAPFSAPVLKGDAGGASTTPGEVALHLRGTSNIGLHWLAGGALGISPGIGAPAFRGFVGIGWGKVKEKPGLGGAAMVDSDRDGVPDVDDACADGDEVVNGYKDDDGCPDELATATLVVREGFDIIPDLDVMLTGGNGTRIVRSGPAEVVVEDLIPGPYDVRTIGSKFAGNVQLMLNEGDGNTLELEVYETKPATMYIIAQNEDGLPIPNSKAIISMPGGGSGLTVDLPGGEAEVVLAPGNYRLFIEAPGYGTFRQDINLTSDDQDEIDIQLKPARTKVTADRIEISEKVFFETGSSTIDERSLSLLDEIGNVLLRNPALIKVEIQGHTDDQGAEDSNLELSQARADAVLGHLVNIGIARERLEAKGFGESTPIADNSTPDGRAQNRRVEFVILKAR